MPPLLILILLTSFLTILTDTTEYTVGTITEVKENAISFNVEYLPKNTYTFEITKETQLYDSKGNKITIADLRPGDRAKLVLLPKTPGKKERICTTLKLHPRKGPMLPPLVISRGPLIMALIGCGLMLTTGHYVIGLITILLGLLISAYPLLV
jgi:hypothetical protein